MKQYTNESQTAKLIELGFEKPKFEVETQMCNVNGQPLRVAMIVGDYSIGELLSFLPLSLEDGDYYALTIRGNKVMYCDPYFDWIEAEWVKHEELIDNLFDACVTLKEEGVI